MRSIRDLQQLGERVWFVEGPFSNWTVLRTAEGVVLIDAGFPEDTPLVVESIRASGGRPEELRSVFVTHAHPDHIGGIPGLLGIAPEARVLVPAAELEATHGPEREQMTLARAGVRFLNPRFAAWALGAARSGGMRPFTIPSAEAFTAEDLEAAGIRALAVPGHTPGSTAFELAEDGLLVTGDALVTDHRSYTRPRTGALAGVFSVDDAMARETAERMPRDRTILPGHGPALLAGS